MRIGSAVGRTAGVCLLAFATAMVPASATFAAPPTAATPPIFAVPRTGQQTDPEVPSATQVLSEVASGESVTVGVAKVDPVSGDFSVDAVPAVGPEQVLQVVNTLAAQPDTVAVGLPQPVRTANDGPPVRLDAASDGSGLPATTTPQGVTTPAALDFYRPATVQRPWPFNQYALDLLCADEVALQNPRYICSGHTRQFASGKGQVVAIIDMAVDTAHPDLAAAVVPGARCVDARNAPCVPVAKTDPARVSDHGTHVAGIVAATAGNSIGIAGMAPDAKVMPVEVIGSSGTGWTSDVAAGITWAVDNGANVLNLSLATTAPGNDPVLAAAVANAVRLGVVVVAAAGNDGPTDNFLAYPAAYPGVIGVGNIGVARTLQYSSTRGHWVDITAPGEVVLSTLPGNHYGYFSGTSMAAPHVAATAALMLQAQPGRSAAEVAATLIRTADDEGPAGRDDGFGYGVLNAVASLDLRSQSAFLSVGSSFVPITPARVLDTRSGAPIGSHQTRTVQITTEFGTGHQVVPPGAVAIAYNLTVPKPAAPGHLRVMPGDVAASPTSAINFGLGETIANGLVAKVDPVGQLRIFNSAGAGTHAVIDVLGYFVNSPGSGFTPIAPLRVYDAAASDEGLLAGGDSRVISVADATPAGASALAYNITVVEPSSTGHLRVMPGDVATSGTSAINWARLGDKVANGLVVAVAADRTIRVHNGSSAPVRFLLDVAGYYTPGAGALFYPITPARAYDSRQAMPQGGALSNAGQRAVFVGDGRDAAGAVVTTAAVPTGASAVAYNVTVPLNPSTSGGHLRVWPAQHDVPNASVLNWAAGGSTRANGSIVGVSDQRQVKIYNGCGEGNHVVLDVLGYYR